MTDINIAIAKLIKDNLPEAVALEMAKYLDTAKNAITENDSLKKSNEAYSTQNALLSQQVSDLKLRENKVNDTEKNLKCLELKLKNFELELLKKEAAIEARVSDASKDATLDVVRLFLQNNTIKTNIQKNVGVPVQGMPANQYNSGTAGFVVSSLDSEFSTVEV